MQLEFFDIPSPCIGTCESDNKGHCLGCMRSRDERQNWKEFSNNEKQKVIKRCIQRKKRKQNKKLKAAQLIAQPTANKVIEITPENELNRQPSLLDPPKLNKPSKAKPSSDESINTDVGINIDENINEGIDEGIDIDFSDFEL